MTAVDFYASEAHFLDHLLPTFLALRREVRGEFFVTSEALERAVALRLAHRSGHPDRHRTRPLAVASGGDLRIASRARGRVVLFEHGAGQSYSNRHISYAGGLGREKVVLFVCPNDQAADRNRRYYPTTRTVVVGSPRVDYLSMIARDPGPRPTVALSFHWRSTVTPESGSAFDHYAGHLAEVRAGLAALDVDVIGHAHPRIFVEASAVYAAAGIEPVASFPEVVARADLYACDNSSTLYEFAALDRPVVVLNAPWYRRHVDHGLRFWTEAEVGLQVDRPEDLVDVVALALSDPPEVARVRRDVVGRVYPVRDGSARAAANELEVLVTGHRCAVCGSAHRSCGPETDFGNFVDLPTKQRGSSVAGLKRYPNPARPGAFVMLNDRDARRLGYLDPPPAAAPAPAPEPDPAPTEDPVVPAPAPADEGPTPTGALRKAGPTARARGTARPAPEADEETAPKNKARPAPSTRRRRRTPEA